MTEKEAFEYEGLWLEYLALENEFYKAQRAWSKAEKEFGFSSPEESKADKEWEDAETALETFVHTEADKRGISNQELHLRMANIP